MEFVTTNDIGEINDLMYAGASLVIERLGVRIKEKTERPSEPPWKRRLNDQVAKYRKDFSRLPRFRTVTRESRTTSIWKRNTICSKRDENSDQKVETKGG